MGERVCQHCGVSIEGRNGNAKFCGCWCRNSQKYLRIKSDPNLYGTHLNRYKQWRSGNIARAREIEANKRAEYKAKNPEKILSLDLKYRRAKSTNRHFQEITAAAAAFMSSLQNQEQPE